MRVDGYPGELYSSSRVAGDTTGAGVMASHMESTVGMCHAVREEGLLIRLLDGELSTSDENKVLAHLRTCHECLGLVADLLYTDERLKDLFSRREPRKERE